MGKLFFVLSLLALGAWVFQTFFTGEGSRFVPNPNYLGLPSTFWSSILFAIFAGSLFEAIYRRRSGR